MFFNLNRNLSYDLPKAGGFAIALWVCHSFVGHTFTLLYKSVSLTMSTVFFPMNGFRQFVHSGEL